MDTEQIKKNLEKVLEELGFNSEFVHVPNIAEPILLIKDYGPTQGALLVSYAFTLIEHYGQGGNGRMGPKCWMTHSAVKEVDGESPSPHPAYHQFEYGATKYFPYSVNLAEYSYNDADSLRELFRNLYNHLDFRE